jgi:diguanylate cyclase (GGDEF)-like protein
MTFIAPLIIAPLVSAPMVKLLFQINALESKMRDLATYDSLTKVLNRRAFLEWAEYAYQLAKREQQQFAILLVDVDFFKCINDEYGHATGDQVLALFGQAAQQISRVSDVVGRIGGEEFAFFLPNTNLAQAEVFSTRLHEAVGKISLDYQGLTIRFSVSVGVAAFSGKSMSNLDALIQLADEAMYRAKKLGRNQTAKVEGL